MATPAAPVEQHATPLGPVERCQTCGHGDLRSVVFLGFLPPVNRLRRVGDAPDAEPWYPAELLACPTCHLVQLGYVADPRVLFPPDYPYTSGSTRILRENFAELAAEAIPLLGLAPNDLVVDIGSNDGTLLASFQERGQRVVGIEPTLTAELALARGVPTVRAFFDRASADLVMREHGSARLVTAANVFAHIPDVHAVVDRIEELVAEDGFFVSESHYLRDLVDTLQYDTIYHEHLRYYSLTSLKALLERHAFRVVHAKRIPTHGGSIRVYATKAHGVGVDVDGSVERLLREEADAGLTGDGWAEDFRRRVVASKLALHELLAPLTRSGARIYGVGAPSRASTLVNYVGLDDGILDCVAELPQSMKLGKYLPGTMIPVVDEARLIEDQPEYALLLSWHIADELRENLRRKGFVGRFVVPLPSPEIVA